MAFLAAGIGDGQMPGGAIRTPLWRDIEGMGVMAIITAGIHTGRVVRILLCMCGGLVGFDIGHDHTQTGFVFGLLVLFGSGP